MATTPMFSPDGTLGDIPNERVKDAQANHFKIGHDMLAPDGKTHGVIPEDRVKDAEAKGFKDLTHKKFAVTRLLGSEGYAGGLGDIIAGIPGFLDEASANPGKVFRGMIKDEVDEQAKLAASIRNENHPSIRQRVERGVAGSVGQVPMVGPMAAKPLEALLEGKSLEGIGREFGHTAGNVGIGVLTGKAGEAVTDPNLYHETAGKILARKFDITPEQGKVAAREGPTTASSGTEYANKIEPKIAKYKANADAAIAQANASGKTVDVAPITQSLDALKARYRGSSNVQVLNRLDRLETAINNEIDPSGKSVPRGPLNNLSVGQVRKILDVFDENIYEKGHPQWNEQVEGALKNLRSRVRGRLVQAVPEYAQAAIASKLIEAKKGALAAKGLSAGGRYGVMIPKEITPFNTFLASYIAINGFTMRPAIEALAMKGAWESVPSTVFRAKLLSKMGDVMATLRAPAAAASAGQAPPTPPQGQTPPQGHGPTAPPQPQAPAPPRSPAQAAPPVAQAYAQGQAAAAAQSPKMPTLSLSQAEVATKIKAEVENLNKFAKEKQIPKVDRTGAPIVPKLENEPFFKSLPKEAQEKLLEAEAKLDKATTPQEISEAAGDAAEAVKPEPKVTKAKEGEHGTGQMAQRAKWAEKKRAQRTKQASIKDPNAPAVASQTSGEEGAGGTQKVPVSEAGGADVLKYKQGLEAARDLSANAKEMLGPERAKKLKTLVSKMDELAVKNKWSYKEHYERLSNAIEELTKEPAGAKEDL